MLQDWRSWKRRWKQVEEEGREADAKGTVIVRIDGQERSCRVAGDGPETGDRFAVENWS